VVDAVLARLTAAQDEFAPARARTLRISTLVSFSEAWLVPNLPEFERAHPEVAVEVEATLRYADFLRDPVDVAIRFGTGPWEGLHSEPILELDFFPVCAPALDTPLAEPQDLARHALIHMTQLPQLWRAWLRAAGVPDLEPRRELRFDHVALVLSAAESGQGVALGSKLGCDARLRAGKLRRPFALSVPSSDAFHFVCRPDDLRDPAIGALRDWLVSRLR
jgi:LysR family glycine cleavage system transcriptional activator